MNKSIKTFLAAVGFVSFFACSQSAAPKDIGSAEPVLSIEQLNEDFKIFETTLREIHPGLYTFIAKDSLDEVFSAAREKLSREMTKPEFFRILSGLISSIYDEHTGVDFSYKYADLEKFLPFKVRWVNRTPYIQKNLLGNKNLVVGSEIISINGRDPRQIYSEILRYYPNFMTDSSLEYDVYSLHFDYLYASFFEQPDSFTVVAINPGSQKQYTVKTPCLLRSDTAHFIPLQTFARDFVDTDPCYKFKAEDGVAIMKISSFTPDCANFDSLLKSDFQFIRENKISDLIIDLRYNRGGDPMYGATLLTYLYSKPFRIFDSLGATLTRIPTYRQYTDTSEFYFGDWKNTLSAIAQLQSHQKNLYTSFRDSVFNPQPAQFTGHTYLLVNSDIHSGASITAALLDYYANPLIIGTPVCGPYNSGCALEEVYLTLPNSQLGITIPLIYYHYNVPSGLYPYKKGISPDIFIRPGITDIVQRKDLVLDTTLSLIKNKN